MTKKTKIDFDIFNPDHKRDYDTLTWKMITKKYIGDNTRITLRAGYPKPNQWVISKKKINKEGRTCRKCLQFLPWESFWCVKLWLNGRAGSCKTCTSLAFLTSKDEYIISNRVLKTDSWNNPPMYFSDIKPAHADLFGKTFI